MEPGGLAVLLRKREPPLSRELKAPGLCKADTEQSAPPFGCAREHRFDKGRKRAPVVCYAAAPDLQEKNRTWLVFVSNPYGELLCRCSFKDCARMLGEMYWSCYDADVALPCVR